VWRARLGLFAASSLAGAALSACAVPSEPACPADQVEDTETGDCVPQRCGAEAWGLLERTGDTVHVAPWGGDGWDGSERWPYRTVRRGIDEADGGSVAVAAGTYEEALELDAGHGGIDVAGRCPELVTIDGGGVDDTTILVTGGDPVLRGLTVTGGSGGIWVQKLGFSSAPEVRLEEVSITANRLVGLAASGFGTTVDVARSVVSDTGPEEGGEVGRGIQVSGGATLLARELVVEGNLRSGLMAAEAGTTVQLAGAVVRDTRPLSDGTYGRGVEVGTGASLVAEDLVLDRNHTFGLLVLDAGTVVEVEDLVVRDTQPLPDGTQGCGVEVADGASLVARGVTLEGNQTAGMFISDAGTSVELHDAEVRDTRPTGEGTFGRGIEVLESASLVARGLVLDGNHEVGLFAGHPGTTLDLEETTVRRTQPRADGTGGWGLELQSGAGLVARALLLEDNHEAGLMALGAGTTLDLEDAVVRGTQPLPDGTGGRGVEVNSGAYLVARGLLAERNHGYGVLVSDPGSTAELEEAVLRDTWPLPDGTRGRGVGVQEGAGLIARDLLVEGSHEYGVIAWGDGVNVAVHDSTVRDTRRSAGGRPGAGILAGSGAEVIADGLLLEQNSEVGLLAVHEGTVVELDATVVRGSLPLADGSFGRGVAVQGGARLTARDLLLEDNSGAGLIAMDPGTVVDLRETAILGTLASTSGASGIGVVVQGEASVTAEVLGVEDSAGPGLYVVDGGELVIESGSLLRNRFAGGVVLGGDLVLQGGVVEGTGVHPGAGGGAGVFAWDLEAPPRVFLDGVAFSDLVGPAAYLRGAGRYVIRGCSVQEAGTWPWLPGGVLAVEGTGPWREVGDSGLFTGLLLEGNSFSELAGDAVLLDSSSATLDVHTGTGAANTFTDLEGVPMVWQRCAEVPPPEIEDGSVVVSCEPVPRSLGSLLEFQLWLTEVEAVE